MKRFIVAGLCVAVAVVLLGATAPLLKESIHVGGGYGDAGSLNSPAGGTTLDDAGNVSADGDGQYDGDLNSDGTLSQATVPVMTTATGVAASLFDAQTILQATTDDTPAALTVGEQTLVGRITAGNITALTPAQVRTLINVEDGADVTDATNVAAAGAVMDTDFVSNGLMERTGAGAYGVKVIGTDVQAWDATLTDIADGTIAENLVNTANPWADNEVSDTLTASLFVGSGSATTAVDLATAEVSGTLAVGNGGSGAATLTDHAVLLGSGTSAVTPTAVPTTGQLLVGYTSNDPYLSTLTGDVTATANGTTFVTALATGSVGADELAATAVTPGSYTIASLTVDADGRLTAASTGDATLTDIADGTIAENLVNTANPWDVNEGGTGAATLTDGGMLLGSGTSAVTAMARPTLGQLLVGNTAGDPYLSTLTGDVTATANGTTFVTALATGSVGADELAATAVTPGSYANTNLTVDADGRITSASSGAGGGTFTDLDLAGDTGSEVLLDQDTITIAGGTGLTTVAAATDTVTINLDNTAVTPGSYTIASLTVDAQGRLTAASTGDATLTDIADGTIAENLVNTANPWADNEVSDTLTASLFVGSGSATTAVDLATAEVSGTLAVTNGGSGAATLTDHGIVLGSGTAAVTVTAVGTTGQVLRGVTGADPAWANPWAGVIILSAAGGSPTTSGGCAAVALSANDDWTLDFDAAADEAAVWMLALPTDYAGGTFTPTFFYSVTSDWVDATDKVNFAIQGMSIGNSDALNTAHGTAVEVNDVWASGETVDELLVITGSAVTLSGSPAAGDFVKFKVYRDADDAVNDTCTADARLLMVRLEYART